MISKNNKIVEKLKKLIGINHRVVKGEVEEIKNLKITDEDKAQGKAAAVTISSALIACGIPLGSLGQPVLEKVMPYIIRDIKDGISTPDKLIVGRVVKEFKAERAEGKLKTDEEIRLENLNK